MQKLRKFYHNYNKVALVVYLVVLVYVCIVKEPLQIFWMAAMALSVVINLALLIITLLDAHNSAKKIVKIESKSRTYDNSPAFMEFLNKLPASTLDLMYTIDKHGNEHRATFTIEDGKITNIK